MTGGAQTSYASLAEETVGRLMAAGVGGAGRMWFNLRVTDRRKDHEIDVVVALPGAGIVCLEVKGGQVSHDGERWLQTGQNGRSTRIDPGDAGTSGQVRPTGLRRGRPTMGEPDPGAVGSCRGLPVHRADR